jgi:hypothetical protein
VATAARAQRLAAVELAAARAAKEAAVAAAAAQAAAAEAAALRARAVGGLIHEQRDADTGAGRAGGGADTEQAWPDVGGLGERGGRGRNRHEDYDHDLGRDSRGFDNRAYDRDLDTDVVARDAQDLHGFGGRGGPEAGDRDADAGCGAQGTVMASTTEANAMWAASTDDVVTSTRTSGRHVTPAPGWSRRSGARRGT